MQTAQQSPADQAVAQLELEPLGDQVYALLRARIISGQLRPGQKLSDLRVSSEFNVSRTPVREARDNVPVNVDIVVFWQVVEPASAVLRVENYAAAVGGAAQTALRDSIGRSDLSQVLSDRAGLDAAMTHALDSQTEPWGIKVQSVQIRDIQIPAVLQDAMSRVAQAERERQARLVLGESEVQVAERFAHAGDLYHDNPMALHLRGMNMLYEVMKAGGTNVVIVPSGAVESMSFGNISGVTALAQEAANLPPAPPPGAPQG